MLFNSISFIIFFPIVVLFYFVIPHRFRWMWLLLTSYYFYMSWNPRYALLLAVSTVITYASGLLIDKSNRIKDESKRTRLRKLCVGCSFILNLAILFVFKYFYFAVDSINWFLSNIGVSLIEPTFDVLLPVAISFYTFQALSYTMDLYRGEIDVERNLGKYALFVAFFPALLAGPIERSKNLLIQMHEKHEFDYDNIKNGLLLMLWGYFLKMVIADRIAVAVNRVYGNYDNYFGFQLVIATVLFAVQIYCDFAGYSYIAKGAAQTMGFRLIDNFKQPYFSTSIREFWGRWHISLSTWFRDYLYIPLGGSRCSRLKKYRNTMITFLVSGLWHGASWNFVVWGFIHGSYQIIGDITKSLRTGLYNKMKIDTKSILFKVGQASVTFALVCFAWIFFRAPTFFDAIQIVERIFINFGFANILNRFSYGMQYFGLSHRDALAAGVSILVLFILDLWQRRMDIRETLAKRNIVIRWGVYYALVFVVILLGAFGFGVSNEFLYFQF